MNTHAPLQTRRATYQDVLDAPEHIVAEILRGELCLQPRPRARHAIAGSHAYGEVYGPFDKGVNGPGGWLIVFEPELHLGDDVIVPDVAGWRRERMPAVPDTAWFDVAPDWVCEVLSPGTRQRDLTVKREIYAEHGVAHLWFVDPEARTLEAFALRGGEWVLAAALAGDAAAAVAPFAAAPFPLSALWAG
jgi:Uma2 family endonuclease